MTESQESAARPVRQEARSTATSSGGNLTALERMARVSAVHFRPILAAISRERQATGKPGIVTGFVGAARQAGTSTVTTCLALAAAIEQQMKTLLVDSNFLSPTVGQKFGVHGPRGFSDCLQDPAESPVAIRESGIRRLAVLPAGSVRLKSRPELRTRFLELAARWIEEFELIVIDLPAASSRVTPVLNRGIDQIYLVANPRQTPVRRISQIKKRLAKREVQLRGLFLNQYNPSMNRGSA